MNRPDFSALAAHDARVFKSGNSLAVRIPSVIAKYCQLEEGAALEVAAEDGMIYLRKVPSKTLEELVDAISPDDVYPELFDGPPAGAERW
jgi:antitoxin component of MazEF toxin-antitoxin module